jgi:hypothetical protein
MLPAQRLNFNARYMEMITDRAQSDFDLIPTNQAIGYVPVPDTNACESALKIRLEVAELRGGTIAWDVAEKVAAAMTAGEAQKAICDGMFNLKPIPNFDRACAAFVAAFLTAYEVNIGMLESDGAA